MASSIDLIVTKCNQTQVEDVSYLNHLINSRLDIDYLDSRPPPTDEVALLIRDKQVREKMSIEKAAKKGRSGGFL